MICHTSTAWTWSPKHLRYSESTTSHSTYGGTWLDQKQSHYCVTKMSKNRSRFASYGLNNLRVSSLHVMKTMICSSLGLTTTKVNIDSLITMTVAFDLEIFEEMVII